MSVKVVSPTESGQPQLPMSLRPHTGRSPLRPSVSSAPPVPGCVEPRKPRRRPVDAGQPELPMTPGPAAEPELPKPPAAGAESRPQLPAAAGSVPERPRPTESRPPVAGSAEQRPVAEPELPMSLRPAAAGAESRPHLPAATGSVPGRPQPTESRPEVSEPEPPTSLRPPAPPVAAGLLTQARRGLAEAERETDPVERFIGAYLAALRGAAAVLAARGRPHRGRARPASSWVLLDSVAPELREWSAFFAGNSAARAAAQAGITGKVTAESAAELVRAATSFLELVRRLVHGLPITGEAHVA
ncbi:SAV_6107 family HEPN domain-containing protein [Amycolatopsis sp. NPDC101161]|uniref:SAV_6107 family HEPN domain-containing protein n=1 Tax=Amycolatopsis sp. NPDC101161 TaxID=3363940 RepID=UPI003802B786